MKSKRKIGVVLNHVSQRSDIRLFIEELSRREDVVLFGSEEDAKILGHIHSEFRIIKPPELGLGGKVYNKVLQQLYFYFGNLPKTRKNYSDYVKRRLRKSKSSWFKIALSLLKFNVKYILPDIFPFDKYIILKKTGIHKIEDLDVFISFTDIVFEGLIARIIKEQKPLFSYVYSWDHVPKFHKFSKKYIKYVTWNKEIAKDLNSLHGVPYQNISIIGASQFHYIHEYLKSPPKGMNGYHFEYIYFPCSFGYPKVARQEVKMIEKVAEKLYEMAPEWKLMVRSYPMLENWEVYGALKERNNIIFDEYIRDDSVLLNGEQHLQKCEVISSSKAVIHAGTTIGLEASYFDVPVLYLNLEDVDYGIPQNSPNHIFRSWGQYHLKKYYALEGEDSFVTSIEKLESNLQQIIAGKKTYQNYNQKLKSNSSLMDIKQFTDTFLKILN